MHILNATALKRDGKMMRCTFFLQLCLILTTCYSLNSFAKQKVSRIEPSKEKFEFVELLPQEASNESQSISTPAEEGLTEPIRVRREEKTTADGDVSLQEVQESQDHSMTTELAEDESTTTASMGASQASLAGFEDSDDPEADLDLTQPQEEDLARQDNGLKDELDSDPFDNVLANEDQFRIQNLRSSAKDLKTKSAKQASNRRNEIASNPQQSSYRKMVSKFETSRDVLALVRMAMKKVRATDKSQKLCYRYVKRSLYSSGLVPKSKLRGAIAIQAVKELKQVGFENLLDCKAIKQLLKNPIDAPKGSILVYKNIEKKKSAGHVEVKTQRAGKWGFVSDFRRKYPWKKIGGQPVRKLVGVFVPAKQKKLICARQSS